MIRQLVGATRSKIPSSVISRGFASSSGTVEIELTTKFLTHQLEKGPSQNVTTSKDELLEFYKLMYTMRRMEIACDNEYKARNIRGFCHLYDGQEAVATGVEAAMTREDSWITSYRCHCVALARGFTPAEIIGELFGHRNGVVRGKGGSMHMYSKKNNFYGGQGIVGAQVPVGTGLAFAAKYLHKGPGPMPVALACYGDGAANQGQVFEAANMAALWDLPIIYGIENNRYGMGTSVERSTANTDYFTMGNKIPGVKIDGMDVLAVKEGMKFCKEWCGNGNGPIFVEFSTYRYHGHSMSDPGVTYRNRDEISQIRASRDPIERVKKTLIDHSLASPEEIKEVEKQIRGYVQEEVKKAKATPAPDDSDAFTDIYLSPDGKSEFPPFIRAPDIAKSLVYGKRLS